MKEVVELLTKNNKTISTMESCTGGGVANAITNIEGSSSVFMFGAVTYSNEYKIKMGVDQNVIEKYSVYSMETAIEMSKSISTYTSSNYGVGITGKINKADPSNPYGEDNKIFISIYDKDNDRYHNKEITAASASRSQNKEIIIKEITEMLLSILK